MRVVYWGTYDSGKPRNRIMIRGLRENGVEVIECHADIWEGVDDKSQIKGLFSKLKKVLSLFIFYPVLVCKYFFLPKHDIIIIGYMGHFDVLIIWLFAHLRGTPICWDVFLSLYDTVVIDRKIVPEGSMSARILYGLEWIGSRAADKLIFDTRTHARYFEDLYNLKSGTVDVVYVGAERNAFAEKSTNRKYGDKFTVLFYGQFIPLHGIDVIVEAARIVQGQDMDIYWVLIGTGQESSRIDRLIKSENIKVIERIPWVPYDHLVYHICMADLCLGIFRGTGKATRVIPNKVFQILAAQRPVITADTQAIRELIKDEMDGIYLIEPDNPESLALKILMLKDIQTTCPKPELNLPVVCEDEVGRQFKSVLKVFMSTKV